MIIDSLTYTRGRLEADKLTRALLDLASQGRRTNCSDAGTSELFLSEHEPERAEACKLCVGCPVIEECFDVGRFQVFGVYGGRDVTVKPGGRKLAAATMEA